MPGYSSFNTQVDPVFEGLEGGPGTLIKYNPLSNVSSPEVWNFLRVMVMLSSFHYRLRHRGKSVTALELTVTFVSIVRRPGF